MDTSTTDKGYGKLPRKKKKKLKKAGMAGMAQAPVKAPPSVVAT